MNKLKFLIFALLATNVSMVSGQVYDFWQTEYFTWEGAKTGNKAVWGPDDTQNTYPSGNIFVKVTMKDPYGLNTTTTNQSEFNDYTKTNAFFGRGNLALQIKSQSSNQSVCLEFEFSNPVVLNKFNIYDIDMLQTSKQLLSTFQDSIHVSAYNMNGEVPLVLDYLSSSPKFVINGQSAKSNFAAGVNGDLSHSDPDGGLLVYSNAPISKFVICAANGPDDDGYRNRHAIKILGFEYREAIGRIEGSVFDFDTKLPIKSSRLILVDYNSGLPIVNKAGELMETTSDLDGQYVFPFLPMGKYKIIQNDPPGYESHSDVDGGNDNIIVAEININRPISSKNDFFEILSSPLPVKISSVDIFRLQGDVYRLAWKAEQEVNNDYYEVSISSDGIVYESLGKVQAKNVHPSIYTFDFTNLLKSGKSYIKLAQYDYGGAYTLLAVKVLEIDGNSESFDFYPNPFTSGGFINFTSANESYTAYRIYNSLGKIVQTSILPTLVTQHSLNLAELSEGFYMLELRGIQTSKSIKIIKR